MKELSEKSEVLQQEEQQRKSWEIKATASEKRIEQLQVRQANPSPCRAGWLKGRGSMHLAVGRAGREMNVHGWEGSCLAGFLIALPSISLSHSPWPLLAAPSEPREQDAPCSPAILLQVHSL